VLSDTKAERPARHVQQGNRTSLVPADLNDRQRRTRSTLPMKAATTWPWSTERRMSPPRWARGPIPTPWPCGCS